LFLAGKQSSGSASDRYCKPRGNMPSFLLIFVQTPLKSVLIRLNYITPFQKSIADIAPPPNKNKKTDAEKRTQKKRISQIRFTFLEIVILI